MFTSMADQMLPIDSRWKPSVEIAPSCPRCSSPNTKFCYYNNYSLSQPRYFCKGCRRYWTKGGSLRNVPVGGGCRKNRRGKSVRVTPYAKKLDGFSVQNQNDREIEFSSNGSESDIDLALVFARFLNNQNSPIETELVNSGASIEIPSENDGSSQKYHPLGLIDETEFSFEGVDQELVAAGKQQKKQQLQPPPPPQEAYMNSIGLQSISGGGDEFLWSEDINLQNFDWQPAIHFPDSENCLISESLVGDNWSSIDIDNLPSLLHF